MPVLIIGWRIYDKLSEEEQKAFALVERNLIASFYECSEYEYAKGNKSMNGVIDALRLRKSYWSSLDMK